jgi:hypothetical protein
MGRYSLLTLVALSAFACEPAAVPTDVANAHGKLACADCHNGGLADRSLALVPDGSCTAAGCHAKDIPSTVALASVGFNHLDHGSTGEPTVGCAGCHTHADGAQPLVAGAETCGLCHEDAVSGARGEDCRLCHTTPDNVGLTSQGVSVPHQGLPWIEGGCLRCHYAVARPVHDVSLNRCAACHDDVAAATQSGIGENLHPLHEGTACASCHEEDNHRIQAMSSAVELDCAACHTEAHGTTSDHAWLSNETCNACHQKVHQGPQQILLGIVPEQQATLPSQHFMDGLTCSSCHFPAQSAQADPGSPTVGTAQACVNCHRAEYATVLRWWNQGLAERAVLVDRYLAGAEAAASGRPEGDPASQAVRKARTLLDLIRVSGGQHNLPLAHRAFEDALAGAADAYRLTGRGVPPAPTMGRAPRQGLCSFCHYRLAEPGFSTSMNDAFHREVVGGR